MYGKIFYSFYDDLNFKMFVVIEGLDLYIVGEY